MITKSKVKIFFKSNIVIAIGINLFFLLLVLLFCDLKYEVSDDFVMAAILSGAYSNTQNPQMIFVNVIIGYLLLPFYKLLPAVSWYFVLQLFLCFLSFVFVTYMLLEELDFFSAITLSILFITFFSNDAYVLTQFTKTAMLAIMAGAMLFLRALFRTKSKPGILLGAVLCLAGTLIRFSTAYIAGGFIVFITIIEIFRYYKANKNDKTFLKHMIGMASAGLILVMFILGAKAWNWYTYNNDESYGYFYAYSSARARIVDYPDYGYEAYEDQLDAIGISENDYYMIRSWNFADNDVFSLEQMERIADIVTSYHENKGINFEQILEQMQDRKFMAYPIFLACLIISIMSIWGNTKRWWTIFAAWIMGSGLLTYFYIRDRVLYRIEYTVFLGIFLTILYFWDRKTKIQLQNIPNMRAICVITSIIFCIIQTPMYLSDNSYKYVASDERKIYLDEVFNASWNYDGRKYRKVVNKGLSSDNLMSEIEAHPDNFYFLDFNTTIQSLYYDWSPFSALPAGYYKNCLYLGGVTTNFPDVVSILKEKELENPLKNLVNKNVYLVDNCNIEMELQYLREHYYPDVTAELYKEVEGYQIWKIIQ